MKIRIASPLHSYTAQRSEVEATGATVAELLADLDRRHPGIRFRIVDEQGRVLPHMKIFVNGHVESRLDAPIDAGDSVHILQALRGG